MLFVKALVTCHNRRDLTLECLGQLTSQHLPKGVNLGVVLVDDGSADGTGAAIRSSFPDINIIEGSGDLFWCGGMRMAWRAAAASDPDYYLLFNDDTRLKPHALELLLKLVGDSSQRVIGVATIADGTTGEVNYGGVNLNLGILGPMDNDECDTFTANCVLIPRQVYLELGMLHETYTHSIGDIDYGLQATKRGIEIKRSSVILGYCASNPIAGTWRDTSLPRLKRYRLLQHPKGLPSLEWCEFCRRNFGWKWPYLTISPVLRILFGR